MKKLIFLMILIPFSTVAQTNPEIAKSAIKIEMLFPEGKSKGGFKFLTQRLDDFQM